MRKRILLLFLALLLVSTVAVAAQMAPQITWWSVDGGAETSTGDGYRLMAVIGQPDAGPVIGDGSFSVAGGYWRGVQESHPTEGWALYLPLLER